MDRDEIFKVLYGKEIDGSMLDLICILVEKNIITINELEELGKNGLPIRNDDNASKSSKYINRIFGKFKK